MSEPMQGVSEDLTADDRLAERTDNGLRAIDEGLPQPSQDPADVPLTWIDAHGHGVNPIAVDKTPDVPGALQDINAGLLLDQAERQTDPAIAAELRAAAAEATARAEQARRDAGLPA